MGWPCLAHRRYIPHVRFVYLLQSGPRRRSIENLQSTVGQCRVFMNNLKLVFLQAETLADLAAFFLYAPLFLQKERNKFIHYYS
jgi:hypothetical protein